MQCQTDGPTYCFSEDGCQALLGSQHPFCRPVGSWQMQGQLGSPLAAPCLQWCRAAFLIPGTGAEG